MGPLQMISGRRMIQSNKRSHPIGIWVLLGLALAPMTGVQSARAGEMAQEGWLPKASNIFSPAFRGKWSLASATHKDPCNRLGKDWLRITITAHRTIYDDGETRSGERLRRIIKTNQPRSVLVELDSWGPSEAAEMTEVWTLSEQGNRLVTELKAADYGEVEPGNLITLVRCK